MSSGSLDIEANSAIGLTLVEKRDLTAMGRLWADRWSVVRSERVKGRLKRAQCTEVYRGRSEVSDGWIASGILILGQLRVLAATRASMEL
eukprot:CAMPEP_0118659640 /NCGR_PEP_ID=MMETSP0785-20121206/15225_1 /TAXON_ID=91992 /ORGANISM="Bolidomonas pacifica, Strain CCMP 1866" /LENGTH=89 /DNA_ID=CAMNT_0006552769 /DNA_START=41 /DNA_END=310 /DNA_ORIENTATION=+